MRVSSLKSLRLHCERHAHRKEQHGEKEQNLFLCASVRGKGVSAKEQESQQSKDIQVRALPLYNSLRHQDRGCAASVAHVALALRTGIFEV